MKRVEYEVVQTKISQDRDIAVPDEIVKKGDKAIEKWLYKTGIIDNALDYAETDTKIKLFYERSK